MIKNVVLTVAWNNDWKSIKNNDKLKLFYNHFHKSLRDLKPFTLHPIFDSLSKLKESDGFRWLICISSGITPFDRKKKIKVCDYVAKIDKYKRKRIWKPQSKSTLNKYI